MYIHVPRASNTRDCCAPRVQIRNLCNSNTSIIFNSVLDRSLPDVGIVGIWGQLFSESLHCDKSEAYYPAVL
jgi:hypothetical protein